MKKLILAVALVAASVGAAHATEPFQFGIALCEYGWHERSNTLLVGSKMNPNFPDDVLKRQEEYCNSKENVLAAMKAHDKYLKIIQEQRESEERAQRWAVSPEGQESLRRQNQEIEEEGDILNACVAGAETNGKDYAMIIGKYKGNGRMLRSLEKSRLWGERIVTGPKGCNRYLNDYRMGY